jgi:hypothetical protein
MDTTVGPRQLTLMAAQHLADPLTFIEFDPVTDPRRPVACHRNTELPRAVCGASVGMVAEANDVTQYAIAYDRNNVVNFARTFHG